MHLKDAFFINATLFSPLYYAAQLFDKISNDPFYENELPSIGNPLEPGAEPGLESQDPPSTDQKLDWLYDGTSDIEDTVSTPDLTTLATSFLEEEQTEQLKMVCISLITARQARANNYNVSFYIGSRWNRSRKYRYPKLPVL